MKASVIIPTFHRSEMLSAALKSVQQQDYSAADYEIIIVDNASVQTQELEDLCKRADLPVVRYVHEARNGLHNARHAGAKAARGNILVYIDDDVVCPSSWLTGVLSEYKDDSIGCVGGRTIPLLEQGSCLPDWFEKRKSGYSILDYGDDCRELHWPEDIYGCNFSVRRSVVFKVGGFHPDGFGDKQNRYYRGDGETGFLKKVYNAGYKVVYTPFGWLYHAVPAARLTEEYMTRRIFSQGLSDSYSRIRNGSQSRPLIFRDLLINGLSLLKGYGTGTMRRGALSEAYLLARFLHKVHVLLSPELYSHILKKSYIE